MTKIDELTDLFSSLPGIGKKSAQKLAVYFVSKDNIYKEEFIKVLNSTKDLLLCQKCFAINENEICDICIDDSRNKQLIVVSNQQDYLHIHSLQLFNSYYFILGGEIESLDEKKISKLRFAELKERIKDNFDEVIIFTNPTISGELTANYIYQILEYDDIKVTKLANGLPIGAAIDYMDKLTIKEAYNNRKGIDS